MWNPGHSAGVAIRSPPVYEYENEYEYEYEYAYEYEYEYGYEYEYTSHLFVLPFEVIEDVHGDGEDLYASLDEDQVDTVPVPTSTAYSTIEWDKMKGYDEGWELGWWGVGGGGGGFSVSVSVSVRVDIASL